MVLAPLAMTSCDDPYYDDWWYDDPDEWYDRPYDNGSDDLVAMAQMLNGSWTGELTNEYTGEDGNRYQTKLYNPAFLREKGLPVPAWLDREPAMLPEVFED